MADYTLSYTGQEIEEILNKAFSIEEITSIEKGGTGATSVAEARNNLGLGNTDSYLPTANGGTGNNLSEAPAGAIIRRSTTSGDPNLWYTATANGAFYATGENVNAKFGTLPIAQGGTGATAADTARKNIGAMGGELLWTNSNTSSNFSPQTISLSALGLTTLTDYAYLIVQFVVSTGASTHQCSAPIFRSTGKYSTQYENSDGAELRRLVSATVGGGVTFDAGKRNETTDNSVMIPEKIYGFKL